MNPATAGDVLIRSEQVVDRSFDAGMVGEVALDRLGVFAKVAEDQEMAIVPPDDLLRYSA
jgi:hypothetical protein